MNKFEYGLMHYKVEDKIKELIAKNFQNRNLLLEIGSFSWEVHFFALLLQRSLLSRQFERRNKDSFVAGLGNFLTYLVELMKDTYVDSEN